MDYDGKNTSEDIVRWVKSRTGHFSTTLTCDQVLETVNETYRSVVFFGPTNGGRWNSLNQAQNQAKFKYEYFDVKDIDCA
jgi:hypothetical protein